ncbi:unnamed protein product [Adineta steineri]|uniref:Uncharacterized protein n=1 Tax=Adineta steineri TaxID=433720 RepID=A0A814UVX6_9BILA|nr:unnamed protein product [Adineta steineri]CAF1181404.1 unnamed protein product [Adineta steineri]CAF4060493.1 unnamed protein product [Adineta steineri]CAF4098959.1 unnamed protein product [Adineta steineri]
MQYVQVFDNQRKHIVRLILNTDNTISYEYFKQAFPDATGLLEIDEDVYTSIPLDGNRNFAHNWNNDIIYDLIYAKSSNNRVPTSSMTYKDKIWAWMGIVGGENFLTLF